MSNLNSNLPTRVSRHIKTKWAECYKKQQLIRYKYRRELYRNYRNDDIKELTLLEHHEIRMNNMKYIRAIYLYVNRNLRSLFSFEKKFLLFVSCIKNKSDDLMKSMENTMEESKHFKDEMKYINLLKKTLDRTEKKHNKKHFLDYGVVIKCSLHRNFCPDIVGEICSYI